MSRPARPSPDTAEPVAVRPAVSGSIGAVAPASGAHRHELEGWLARHGISDVEWFAPGDLHDLDRAVRRGRIGHVVFPGAADLLEGVWEEEIVFEEWIATGVRIDFTDVPESGSTTAAASPGHALLRVDQVVRSWETWRHRHRRRQALAGAVVSAAILAISFVLCVVLAP